jgi:hypothetical protein
VEVNKNDLKNKLNLNVKIMFNEKKFRRKYFGEVSKKSGCLEREPPSEVVSLPFVLMKAMQVRYFSKTLAATNWLNKNRIVFAF